MSAASHAAILEMHVLWEILLHMLVGIDAVWCCSSIAYCVYKCKVLSCCQLKKVTQRYPTMEACNC